MSDLSFDRSLLAGIVAIERKGKEVDTLSSPLVGTVYQPGLGLRVARPLAFSVQTLAPTTGAQPRLYSSCHGLLHLLTSKV